MSNTAQQGQAPEDNKGTANQPDAANDKKATAELKAVTKERDDLAVDLKNHQDALQAVKANLEALKAERDQLLEAQEAASAVIDELKAELILANRAAGKPVEFTHKGKNYRFRARKFTFKARRTSDYKHLSGDYSAEQAAENEELLDALIDTGSGLIEEV